MSVLSKLMFLQIGGTGDPSETYRGSQLATQLEYFDRVAGLLDVILPFLLIFTLVFAVLQKSEILGKGKKNYNVIVALVMGLVVVIPHVIPGGYPANRDVVDIINNALPQVSLVIIAIVMVLLLLGIWGAKIELAGQSLPAWMAAISALIILFIFGNAAGILPSFLRTGLQWSDAGVQMTVIILVFGIIIWFITKEDKPKDDKKPTLAEELSKTLTGGGK